MKKTAKNIAFLAEICSSDLVVSSNLLERERERERERENTYYCNSLNFQKEVGTPADASSSHLPNNFSFVSTTGLIVALYHVIACCEYVKVFATSNFFFCPMDREKNVPSLCPKDRTLKTTSANLVLRSECRRRFLQGLVLWSECRRHFLQGFVLRSECRRRFLQGSVLWSEGRRRFFARFLPFSVSFLPVFQLFNLSSLNIINQYKMKML